jgi:heme/copper-type cytochrome/quinol oxidase subunit 3
MTTATIDTAPTAARTELARGRGGGGPAPKRIVVAYGFWIFILSDIVMFSALFAAYAVLAGNTAGGLTGAELFNLRNVFIETMCLLLSSYTCGLGALSAERRQTTRFLLFAVLTFVLGASPAWWREAPDHRAAPFSPASSRWWAHTARMSPAG